jgi:prepilin-type N-terminal cleavage/methylation domain-containing protein
MVPLLRERKGGQRGFVLLESLVSMVLLGVIAVSALGGLLFGITQAQESRARAAASAWTQSELDYLLLQGYAALAPSVRRLGTSDTYSRYGDYAEPQMPTGFDHAVIRIEPVWGVPVKQVTVTLYRGQSTPYTVFSTYISDLVKP